MTVSTSRAKRRQRFAAADKQLAAWARALGHPARLAILRFLAGRETCYCGQIVDELPLAQSTVSQHLRELKHAGLVCGTVAGTRVCYCLDPAVVERMRAAFDALGTELAQAAACSPAECTPKTGADGRSPERKLPRRKPRSG